MMRLLRLPSPQFPVITLALYSLLKTNSIKRASQQLPILSWLPMAISENTKMELQPNYNKKEGLVDDTSSQMH